jgi:hypothetical protein
MQQAIVDRFCSRVQHGYAVPTICSRPLLRIGRSSSALVARMNTEQESRGGASVTVWRQCRCASQTPAIHTTGCSDQLPRRYPKQEQKRPTRRQAVEYSGAPRRSRTADLRITNALLYQLSYWGTTAKHYNRTSKAWLITLLVARAASPIQRWDSAGIVASSALAPFQKICTPMHSRMNAESFSTTLVPVSPRPRMMRSE